MKNRRNTVSVIALAMIMVVTNLAYAEGPANGPAKGPDKQAALRAELRTVIAATRKGGQEQDRNSQEELEKMRSALLDLANSVKDVTELAPETFDAGRLDEATRQLTELSYEQLGKLRKVLNPANISERLATARAPVAEYKLSVQREGRIQIQSAGRKKGGAVGISSAGFPVATGFCRGNGPNRIPVGVVLAADIVYFVAETVRDLAQDACNEVVLGFNGSLACIATDTIYVIAHAVYEGIHFCDEELTGKIVDANYDRLDHIHTDLENSVANDNTNTANIVANDNSNKAMIITNDNTNTAFIVANDNTNRALIIANDNTNRALIIANDNANTATILANANANKNELRDLILRTQIEADLASTDGSPFVAAYITPNANGGYLDLVMTIVTQTLANIQAAGGSIGNAQTFLNQANAAKTAGDFKGAYTLYRKAYKMAGK